MSHEILNHSIPESTHRELFRPPQEHHIQIRLIPTRWWLRVDNGLVSGRGNEAATFSSTFHRWHVRRHYPRFTILKYCRRCRRRLRHHGHGRQREAWFFVTLRGLEVLGAVRSIGYRKALNIQ